MRKSPLLPIFLIVLVDILGMTIILPLLPFYAEHFGASPTVVGLLVAAFAACQLVAGPLLGRLSDTAGRKPLLIVSQIGTFIGFLILAFAQSLWMVFLSRVIDGLTAGNLSLAQAYIADVTEPKDRARAFGVIGIAFGIGFLIGPAISGLLSKHGYAYPIYVAAGLSFTSIMATTFLLPRVKPDEGKAQEGPAGPGGKRLSLLAWGSYADYFRREGLGGLLHQFFAFCVAFALFTSGFALFAERRFTWDGKAFGAQHVGYIFAYAGFLGIILQGGLIGRLVRRFGERRLVLAGFASLAVGYSLLGLSSSIAMLVVATTISSFGNGALRPALTALITQSVGRNEQGVVLGLTQSLMSVAQIVAPLIAGTLIDHQLLVAWALAIAATALIGLAVRPPAPPASAPVVNS